MRSRRSSPIIQSTEAVAEQERAARALEESEATLEDQTKEEPTTPEQPPTEPTNELPANEPSGEAGILGKSSLGKSSDTSTDSRGENLEGDKEVTGKVQPSPSERIVSATYTDDSGTVHESSNHTLAAEDAKVKAPNSRKGRETREERFSPKYGKAVPEYGFMAEDSNGNERVVTRKEAVQIADAAGQLKDGVTPADIKRSSREKLHSQPFGLRSLKEGVMFSEMRILQKRP